MVRSGFLTTVVEGKRGWTVGPSDRLKKETASRPPRIAPVAVGSTHGATSSSIRQFSLFRPSRPAHARDDMSKFASFRFRVSRRVVKWFALVAVAMGFTGCETPGSRERLQATPNPRPPVAVNAPEKVSPTTPGTASVAGGAWRVLFDGKTLQGWAVTDFAGRGEVKVDGGKIILESGIMTGVNWTNAGDLPRLNYEISLDAMRVEGSDFFCGLTFPVNDDPCSLIVGGWGGGVVGLSSLDGQDAANNDTTKYMNFDNGRWFAIRVRVTEERIQCWIDDDRVVDVETKDRRISIRPEVEASRPLGVATWSTAAALKNIRLRKL